MSEGTPTVTASSASQAVEENTSEEKVDPKEVLQREEEKLKAKLPQLPNRPVGHSAFLQKRLAKGQKYFDSGDYNMARQRGPTTTAPKFQPALQQPTGDTIPTPESIPSRKTSILTSKRSVPPITNNE
ncbi:cAMP-regulated phosphoprotein 19-like [Artemia franciscana]|uniref:Alpha-endosulfine n=1 Tax=Artemia franciscana TaxID=6661 RepID=A0AA88I4U2_ARTSF|nr:hypothetical protein QYM36_005536 [Artemia franciscana]KAK2718262.1 hypothetical protein QYM36_005536 [Artemia franciscana]